MNTIERMLVGELDISDFIVLLKSDPALLAEIRALLPADAVNNPDHPIWKKYAWDALNKSGFDLVKHILSICRLDGTIGDNLNLSSILAIFYSYAHPNVHCTTKYRDECSIYLDISADCFEGPEVEGLVEQIVKSTATIKAKSKRMKTAKAMVYEAFHITDRKRPRWIQGAEWPHGKSSPMRFLESKHISEGVQYIFQDVDTGEIRVVEQYY